MISEICHCGRPILVYPAGLLQETEFTRGLCKDCDLVRCDAFPCECPFRQPVSAHWIANIELIWWNTTLKHAKRTPGHIIHTQSYGGVHGINWNMKPSDFYGVRFTCKCGQQFTSKPLLITHAIDEAYNEAGELTYTHLREVNYYDRDHNSG